MSGKSKFNNRGNSRDRKDQNGKRGKRDFDRDRENAVRGDSGFNDPNWYAANPQLLKDVASLSYNVPVGSPVVTDAFGLYESTDKEFYVPGIFRISYIPTFGISKDNSSALNTAARRYYSFVRKANSGARNYESADLMLFILGTLQAFTYWAWMVRIYGLLNYYRFRNRYTPRILVESMSVNYEDLIHNMAQFRAYINTYAAKLSCVAIPGDLNYIKRAMWCTSHIWKDSNDDKAQLYYYNPTNFYTYEEMTSERGGRLVPVHLNSDSGLAEIATFGDDLIARLIESEDIAIMSGDIIKAFGDDKLMRIAPISDDFAIEPEYSEEVCMQIQNATCWRAGIAQVPIEQDPNTGAILYNPTEESSTLAYAYPTTLLLNMRKDTTPEYNMVATRMMNFVNISGETLSFDSCGSEIVTDFAVITLKDGGEVRTYNYNTMEPLVLDNSAAYVEKMFALSNFDYHPIMYCMDPGGGFLGLFADVDNYTTVSAEDLHRMHDVAILSLLDSPGMGSLSIQ